MAGHRCRYRRHRSSSCPPLILATPPEREVQLVEFGKTLSTCRARRLIREFDLPLGHHALERIWPQHALGKHRRNYQRKQDLAHSKAQWRSADQRRPQGSRYSALLAAGLAAALAARLIHGTRIASHISLSCCWGFGSTRLYARTRK